MTALWNGVVLAGWASHIKYERKHLGVRKGFFCPTPCDLIFKDQTNNREEREPGIIETKVARWIKAETTLSSLAPILRSLFCEQTALRLES